MKIYAPVKDANGVWASVRFVDGVGETNDPVLIEWFRTHGYKVPLGDINCTTNASNKADATKVKAVVSVVMPDKPKPDLEYLDTMTPMELRDWAIQNGYGSLIKNTRNKAKLLEILRG